MPGLSLIAVSEGYTLVAVCGLLIVVASPVVKHRILLLFSGAWAQELQLSGSRAWVTCSAVCGVFWTRDEPVSPALTGSVFTTESPGKPLM